MILYFTKPVITNMARNWLINLPDSGPLYFNGLQQQRSLAQIWIKGKRAAYAVTPSKF